jgi:hypothetical protein
MVPREGDPVSLTPCTHGLPIELLECSACERESRAGRVHTEARAAQAGHHCGQVTAAEQDERVTALFYQRRNLERRPR